MPALNPFQLVLSLAATAPAAQAPTHEAISRGFTLLLLLASAGVLLVMVCVLLLVLRRNRHAQQRLDRRLNRPSSKASAWHAAGARAQPLHPDPDLPSDDELGFGHGHNADPQQEQNEGNHPGPNTGPNSGPHPDPEDPEDNPDDSGPWDLPDRSS